MEKDLRTEWLIFEEGTYRPVERIPFSGLNTIYFQLDPRKHTGDYLQVASNKPYFLFVDGSVRGEFRGQSHFRIDSLITARNRPAWIALHQQTINERDLVTTVVSPGKPITAADAATALRPYNPFRDFVVVAGLLITILFLAAFRLNPKLGADYFAIDRIFASREMDDSQASARLTVGSNVQFYVLCSLLIGYYLLMIVQHLPAHYQWTVRFVATDFWMFWWQWLKLSALVLLALLSKALIIFSLTRLFDMRGMTRFHFFNWIRLLLVAIGAATVVLFMYYISHGDDPGYYVVFLSVVIAVLVAWIVVAFFKLSGRTGHSIFHLFSYLCATEIIPLIITVKVLFQ